MDLKTFVLKAACLLLLNRQTLCLLKRTDPNVCEILVSGENDNSEAYKIECCLNYFEDDDLCKPCKPGNFGRQCSETCVNGYYGSQCKGVCSCTKYERCDPVTGCECIDFTGTNCRYKCPAGFYGKDCVNICQCIRGIDCDSVTGSCICPAGFTGPSCTKKCLKGYFGENCFFNCSCSRNSVCHSISGECLCSPGFIGETCAEKCPAGFYGKDCVNICQCIRGIDCDSVTGSCICPAGFTGPSCTKKCSEGLYGENCAFNCSCPTSSVCDSISGNCSCNPGFIGETCTEKCPKDFYGQNCFKRCDCANDLSCHPVQGTCQCQNNTNDCENLATKPNNGSRNSKMLMILLSCAGGSMLLIAVFIHAVCFFKRKNVQESVNQQQRRPLSEINHYDEINPDGEISLDIMPVESDTVNVDPYYSYPREQTRRLSLPITNGQMNNRTRNENRVYISLPNLINDGTYLSPYYSLESDRTHATRNQTDRPLQGGDIGNSGYLHPYNVLHRHFDPHDYTKIEHTKKDMAHTN